jgi:large subunit ribosomal protein L43
MATRGVYQLTKLNIYYCEIGGSSRALRDYIGNGQLVAWATKYPHVNIEVKRNNGYHPIIHADYVTNSKRILHQVSVKNYESWEHVEEVLMMLSNRSGRKITRITKDVLSDTPSSQGVWTPFLNLQHEPSFDVQIVDPASQQHDKQPSMTSTSM